MTSSIRNIPLLSGSFYFYSSGTLPAQLAFLWLLLLAYLTEKWQINIGSGDFLYLASLALICGFTELLWIIQISSLLGLLVFAIFKPKSIPYVPLLFFQVFLSFCASKSSFSRFFVIIEGILEFNSIKIIGAPS